MQYMTTTPDLEAARQESRSGHAAAGKSATNHPAGFPMFNGDAATGEQTPERTPTEHSKSSKDPTGTGKPKIKSKMDEFLEKYDPRSVNVPNVFPMSEHRALVRTMLLDCILFSTAQLNKHNWILLSQNKMYTELCTPQRVKQIQEDLESYIRSVRNYEYWLTCWMQNADTDSIAMPPSLQSVGKTLAMMECASHAAIDSELPILQSLSEGLTLSIMQWSMDHAQIRAAREAASHQRKQRVGLVNRIAMAIFAGATLIVPMVIMTLFPSKLVTLVTTGASTLAIGLILAWWMVNAENKDIIAATAAYAAVLVVFVGSGENLVVSGNGAVIESDNILF